MTIKHAGEYSSELWRSRFQGELLQCERELLHAGGVEMPCASASLSALKAERLNAQRGLRPVEHPIEPLALQGSDGLGDSKAKPGF